MGVTKSTEWSTSFFISLSSFLPCALCLSFFDRQKSKRCIKETKKKRKKKLHQVLSIVALSLSSVFLNPQKDRISLAVYCMHILLPCRKEVVFVLQIPWHAGSFLLLLHWSSISMSNHLLFLSCHAIQFL